MKKMPTRDTNGNCRGPCRNRVREGEEERQRAIASQDYSAPAPNSPPWTRSRNEPPGVWDGHM
jgi:hypothetical protein